MILSLFAALFCTPTMGFAESRRDAALRGLAEVEQRLVVYKTLGLDAPADEILNLITQAQRDGVLSLPIPSEPKVRYRYDDALLSIGEFGSSTSQWRLGGAVAATAASLSFDTVDVLGANRSYVSVQARLLGPWKAFGVEHREFSVALNVDRSLNSAKLTVELVGRDYQLRRQGGAHWSEAVARVYELPLAPTPTVDWRQFELVGTGCHVLLE